MLPRPRTLAPQISAHLPHAPRRARALGRPSPLLSVVLGWLRFGAHVPLPACLLMGRMAAAGRAGPLRGDLSAPAQQLPRTYQDVALVTFHSRQNTPVLIAGPLCPQSATDAASASG